jgi:hypothetical protein
MHVRAHRTVKPCAHSCKVTAAHAPHKHNPDHNKTPLLIAPTICRSRYSRGPACWVVSVHIPAQLHCSTTAPRLPLGTTAVQLRREQKCALQLPTPSLHPHLTRAQAACCKAFRPLGLRVTSSCRHPSNTCDAVLKYTCMRVTLSCSKTCLQPQLTPATHPRLAQRAGPNPTSPRLKTRCLCQCKTQHAGYNPPAPVAHVLHVQNRSFRHMCCLYRWPTPPLTCFQTVTQTRTKPVTHLAHHASQPAYACVLVKWITASVTWRTPQNNQDSGTYRPAARLQYQGHHNNLDETACNQADVRQGVETDYQHIPQHPAHRCEKATSNH